MTRGHAKKKTTVVPVPYVVADVAVQRWKMEDATAADKMYPLIPDPGIRLIVSSAVSSERVVRVSASSENGRK